MTKSMDDVDDIRKTIRIPRSLQNSITDYRVKSDYILNESEVIRQAISIGLTKMKEHYKHD